MERDPHQWSERVLSLMERAFTQYTGFEGLREAFYAGGECYNCEGITEYDPGAKDSPASKAFTAGYGAFRQALREAYPRNYV